MERRIDEAVFGKGYMSVGLGTDKTKGKTKLVANADKTVWLSVHFGYAGTMDVVIDFDKETGKVEVLVRGKVVHSQTAPGWEHKVKQTQDQPQGEDVDLRQLNRSLGALAESLKKKSEEPQTYEYYIDLDERDEFRASVRDENDKVVFQIDGPDIFEEGWMKNKEDIAGLEKYLKDLKVIGPEDEVIKTKDPIGW